MENSQLLGELMLMVTFFEMRRHSGGAGSWESWGNQKVTKKKRSVGRLSGLLCE